MYFIFIFVSPSISRSSVKKSVNHLIKQAIPYFEIHNDLIHSHDTFHFILMVFENIYHTLLLIMIHV